MTTVWNNLKQIEGKTFIPLGGLTVLCERVWKPVQHAIEESRKYCIAYLGEYRLFTVISAPKFVPFSLP